MSPLYIECFGQCMNAWIDHLIKQHKYTLCFFEKPGHPQCALCLSVSGSPTLTDRVTVGFRFSRFDGTIFAPDWRNLVSLGYEPTVPTVYFAQSQMAQFLLSWKVSGMTTCAQQQRSVTGAITNKMDVILGINLRERRSLYEKRFSYWVLLSMLTGRLPKDVRCKLCLDLLAVW